MPLIRSIRKVTKRVFDVHLMIVEPERYVKEFAACGSDSITFHLEATEDAEATINLIKSHGCRAGMSIKPKTPVEAVRKYLNKLDMLLVMTVGGDMDIQVDGGITVDNAKLVLDAGANIIVAGSAVFGGNITENVKGYLAEF